MGRYPILQGQCDEAYEARRNHTLYPRGVSWDLIKDHEQQAQINHGQSLEQLAKRGGLSPKEFWCVVNDKKWYSTEGREMTEAKAIEWLRSLGDLVDWGRA